MTQTQNKQSIQGRTALIVIHGIGEQNLLDTLDQFTRGLVDYFKSKSLEFKQSHRIAARENLDYESFVRLKSTDNDEDFIDIHEYYWAYQTETQIQITEVMDWMQNTLNGTRNFYKKFYRQNEGKPGIERKFPLANLARRVYIFSWIYPILRILIWLGVSVVNLLPIGPYIRSAWSKSKTLAVGPIVGYIGDITIYTTTDKKSPYYQIREKILADSIAFVESILKDKDAKYDRVIIAGHSLGSVISYDTLNRLCLKASLPSEENCSSDLPLNKIAGLVTFGSPLDKVSFFLGEKVEATKYIRKQILEHLNSFRSKQFLFEDSPQTQQFFKENPVNHCHLEKVKWINYYHKLDPISGCLDSYENLENKELTFDKKWGVEAHSGYWEDPEFLDGIAINFLLTESLQPAI